MTNILYETALYKVIIGESSDISDLKCYKVTNKDTDVVEAESQVWPQAVQFADDIQGAVDKINTAKAWGGSTKEAISLDKH